MKILSFAVLLVEVSAACVDSSLMRNNIMPQKIVLKTADKARITRCSPRVIRPVKRIAPAWRLRDLYEGFSSTTENDDKSVQALTTPSITTGKEEVVYYIPYKTSMTTEEETADTSTDEDTSPSTLTTKRISTTKTKKIKHKNKFIFLASTRPTFSHKNNLKKNDTKTVTTTPKNIQNLDDKEINFDFLSKFGNDYDEAGQTKNKIIKAIERLKNQGRGIFTDAKNGGKNKTTGLKKTRNSSSTLSPGKRKKIDRDRDSNNEDTSAVKRFNHDLSFDTDTTSVWKKNKGKAKQVTDMSVFNEASHRRDMRQNFRDNYSDIVDKLRHVLFYDISRRPELTRNSLQKFGLVYVPIPLKLKARYNNLNHFPVNPRMQVLLSNYGYYLPGSLGIGKFRGLYNHLAYNNMYHKKPFGVAVNDLEPDTDSWYT